MADRLLKKRLNENYSAAYLKSLVTILRAKNYLFTVKVLDTIRINVNAPNSKAWRACMLCIWGDG